MIPYTSNMYNAKSLLQNKSILIWQAIRYRYFSLLLFCLNKVINANNNESNLIHIKIDLEESMFYRHAVKRRVLTLEHVYIF